MSGGGGGQNVSVAVGLPKPLHSNPPRQLIEVELFEFAFVFGDEFRFRRPSYPQHELRIPQP